MKPAPIRVGHFQGVCPRAAIWTESLVCWPALETRPSWLQPVLATIRQDIVLPLCADITGPPPTPPASPPPLTPRQTNRLRHLLRSTEDSSAGVKLILKY